MSQSISYVFNLCRFMCSSQNPKRICRSDTCCGTTFGCIGIFIIVAIGICGTFATLCGLGYLSYYILFYNVYDMHTGCLLNSQTECKPPHHGFYCYLGSHDGIFGCVGIGCLSIIFLGVLSVLIWWIGMCKHNVVESFESAQELTDVYIDECRQHYNWKKK